MQGSTSTSALRSAIARIYLRAGYISKASEHFAVVKADLEATQSTKDMNDAFLSSAEGDWQRTVEILKNLLVNDPNNFVVSSCSPKVFISVLIPAIRPSTTSRLRF